jgi:OmpA-OmpF porin, OOP family
MMKHRIPARWQHPLAAVCAVLFVAGSANAQPVDKVVVNATAHFSVDSAHLRSKDRARILAEVAQIKDVTWQRVSTTGHTDSVGSVRHNERLASRRAGIVKRYLVDKGLDPAMITTAGKASTEPVADNATAGGRANNRRTDIRFEGVRVAAR